MNIPSLFLILGTLASPPQMEQELQRQRQEILRLESRLAAQERETERLIAELEQQQTPCDADIRPTDGSTVRSVPEGEGAAVRLNVVSTVSQPVARCLPASVWVTASYLDADGELICSGTVRDIARQNTPTGSVSLELRPWSLVNFVRWLNEPPRTNSGPQRLACFTPDGQIELTTFPAGGVASLWVRFSLFPSGGGLATADFRMDLR